MSGQDPVLELVGWKAEPLLLRRLKLYIFEGAVELASLAGALYLAETRLTPPGLFLRLLVLPLGIVSLKLCWNVRLAIGYYWVRNSDVATVIRRMGHVHSRSCWSCSAATLTCFSCVLMVWHAIMFLLMTGYHYTTDEAFAVRVLLGTSALFVIVNWALWRDFVNHYKDAPEEPDDVRLLYQIFKMHKSKAIVMFKHCELAMDGGRTAPTTCAVCLEDFKAEDIVAQLPCGHTFHPTCAHKWILEDWRCPFRCSLSAQKVAAQTQASSVQEADLEAGNPHIEGPQPLPPQQERPPAPGGQ